MNYALGVGSIESISNLDSQTEQSISLHESPRDPMCQCHSIEVLHCDEAFAVVLSDFVDGADIGMVQRRSSTGFAAEALQSLRVFRDIIGQELERDKTTEGDIFGLVNDTHPATAEFLDDAVVRDGLADHLKWTSSVWTEHVRSRPGASQRRVDRQSGSKSSPSREAPPL